MKGGTSASSNRASYSGTSIVSWPFIEEMAGSFGHQNMEQDLGTISSQRAQQPIRKVISSLAFVPPFILIHRPTSPAPPVVASRFHLEIRGQGVSFETETSEPRCNSYPGRSRCCGKLLWPTLTWKETVQQAWELGWKWIPALLRVTKGKRKHSALSWWCICNTSQPLKERKFMVFWISLYGSLWPQWGLSCCFRANILFYRKDIIHKEKYVVWVLHRTNYIFLSLHFLTCKIRKLWHVRVEKNF